MSEAIKRRARSPSTAAPRSRLTITAEDAHELRARLPKLRLGVLPYALDGTPVARRRARLAGARGGVLYVGSGHHARSAPSAGCSAACGRRCEIRRAAPA